MRIRRLAASINACFDDLVAKVENHEAVAHVAIADVQKAAAKIRAEKIKVDQNLKRLTEQQEEQEQAVLRWQQRARACASEDEDKALQCLRQIKNIKSKAQQTDEQHSAMLALASSLADSLQEVENKLTQLMSKRAMLASRESRAMVMNTSQKAHQELGSMNVDEVFDRWELNVLQSEYLDGGQVFTGEPRNEEFELAKTFAEAEEKQALLRELDILKSEINAQTDGELSKHKDPSQNVRSEGES